jgi:hypothetical protein
MREHFTSQTLNAWLDTAGGMAWVVQHGGRAQAAAAMARQEAADRQWRLERATEKAERYPERYASVADALRDIPEPLGGGGAQLTGSTDDIVAKARRIDPLARWHNAGYEQVSEDGGVYTYTNDGMVAADTRPPWQR